MIPVVSQLFLYVIIALEVLTELMFMMHRMNCLQMSFCKVLKNWMFSFKLVLSITSHKFKAHSIILKHAHTYSHRLCSHICANPLGKRAQHFREIIEQNAVHNLQHKRNSQKNKLVLNTCSKILNVNVTQQFKCKFNSILNI